ncbi:kinase-like protein, partial [Fistulina hepatica ATCC 64428]
ISHPNITPLLSYLSTAHHHVLVLPYCSGGDLLYLVNDDHSWIFTELAKAVGWMHGVGLVHRDIKLESDSRAPLVQLTDFGLSRFIDPESPFLTTKCGSEAYAAPELIASAYGDGYDARLTDAWACGVVLYALACRQLPFGEGP